MKKTKIRRLLTVVVLFIIFAIIIIPLLWAVALSFDRTATTALPAFSLLPHEPTLFNYQAASKMINLAQYYINTVIVVLINTSLAVLFSMMCGFAFAKLKFVGKKFWYIFMLAVMMVPFESRLVPLFLQYRDWGLLNTWWPLIWGSLPMYTEPFSPDPISARYRIHWQNPSILTAEVNGEYFSASFFLCQNRLWLLWRFFR